MPDFSEDTMIEKLYESYDDNNYYIETNKKKLAHDNLAVVGGMLAFFLFISVLFVAMALAFGNGLVAYVKYFPAIGVLAILLVVYMQIIRKKFMHTSIRQIANIPPSSSQMALKIKSFLTMGIFSGAP